MSISRRTPVHVREHLTEVREAIQRAAPEATEKISYRIPTFHYHGNLVHFAAGEMIRNAGRS